MIGSILGILSGLFGALSTALGWAKSASDQNIGKTLQAKADEDAIVKEAQDGQKTANAVDGLSRDDLIRELSGVAKGDS